MRARLKRSLWSAVNLVRNIPKRLARFTELISLGANVMVHGHGLIEYRLTCFRENYAQPFPAKSIQSGDHVQVAHASASLRAFACARGGPRGPHRTRMVRMHF